MIKIWGRNTSVNVQKVMWAIGEKHADEPAAQVMQRFSRLGTIDLRVDYLRPAIGEFFTDFHDHDGGGGWKEAHAYPVKEPQGEDGLDALRGDVAQGGKQKDRHPDKQDRSSPPRVDEPPGGRSHEHRHRGEKPDDETHLGRRPAQAGHVERHHRKDEVEAEIEETRGEADEQEGSRQQRRNGRAGNRARVGRSGGSHTQFAPSARSPCAVNVKGCGPLRISRSPRSLISDSRASDA